MSKLGKKLILLPKESNIKVDGGNLLVSGPKGSKNIPFNAKLFSVKTNEKNEFQILPTKKEKNTSVLWGTYRGFRANLKGQDLVLSLGFSHEVIYKIPKEIAVKVEKQTKINITGPDKELVSKTASEIKAIKAVEPYKGKGIKEKGQYVLRKEGKKK